MAHKRRSLFVIPFIVLLFSLAGGIYGPQVSATAAASDSDNTQPSLDNEVETVTRIASLVERNEAERPSAETIYYKGAIPGMLRELDPHSNFFDPKDYKLLMDDQKGSYSGVGMTVSARNGKIVIIAPFPGSPAYKIGLRPGDIIVSVNDKSTEGLNTTEVAELLKGPRGTPVKVVISREGMADYLPFTIVREDITRKSVPEAFYLDTDATGGQQGIAYIKILSFTETTAQELDDAMRQLDESKMHGLVLDLRGESRRAVERRRIGGRTLSAEGPGGGFRARPQLPAEGLHRARGQPWARLPHRRAGEPHVGFRGGNCLRSFAGSRPRLDAGRETPSARAWCRPCTRCPIRPPWR